MIDNLKTIAQLISDLVMAVVFDLTYFVRRTALCRWRGGCQIVQVETELPDHTVTDHLCRRCGSLDYLTRDYSKQRGH